MALLKHGNGRATLQLILREPTPLEQFATDDFLIAIIGAIDHHGTGAGVAVVDARLNL